MFAFTGVTKPNLDVAGLNAKGDHYAALARAAGTTHDHATMAARTVLESNTGEAALAFDVRVLRRGSITQHFEHLRAAAERTSAAYRTAARDGGNAQTAMIDLDAKRDQLLFWALLRGANVSILSTLVRMSREDLLRIESAGVDAINNAFANLQLPDPFVVDDADLDGRLDPNTEQTWRRLSDDQRKRALQEMADAYAKENGFPSIEIDFVNLQSRPGTRLFGVYDPTIPGAPALKLNATYLSDPAMIGAVIHEMQHRNQLQAKSSGCRGKTS